MTKLSKEMVLPLASMFAGPYTEELKQSMESFDWSETMYNTPASRGTTLTKKQVKARAKNKAARKARKKNKK